MRQEAYSLPDGFKWDTLLLDDPLVLKEVTKASTYPRPCTDNMVPQEVFVKQLLVLVLNVDIDLRLLFLRSMCCSTKIMWRMMTTCSDLTTGGKRHNDKI